MNPLFLKKIDGVIGTLVSQLCPRPMSSEFNASAVSRILLIRPGGIGDAVLMVPLVRFLRESFPLARIEVLAEKRNCGVFALCPVIDKVHIYDSPRDLFRTMGVRYDMVIDTEQWHHLSAVVARLVRSEIKIGFGTNGRRRMFTHPVVYSHDRYEMDSFFELLSPLGIKSPSKIDSQFLEITESTQSSANAILGNFLKESFIVLFPGASIVERCWGTENFRQLAICLEDIGFSVVVVGGQEDGRDGDEILSGLSGLNVAGKTSLAETAGILKKAQLLISGDSGVLHLAVGLGMRTVSLFGPGIQQKWAPRGGQHIVINHKLICSPCTRFGTTPPCPIGAKCLRDISVDEVFVAAQKLLGMKLDKGGH